MFRPERWEYRITLTDVDRGLNAERTVVVGRHPSETSSHLTLRVLAYCLIYEEDLTFGPGVSIGDGPDLMVHDLTGQLRLWIGVGDITPDVVKKVLQHNREAKVHIVFESDEQLQAFLTRIRHWPKLPRHWNNLTLWLPPPDVVTQLEAMENLRQRWVVTISGGHLYLEVDDLMLDGVVNSWQQPT